MSDGNQDLRTRIAAAIAQADGDIGPDSWDYKLADAVIRELSELTDTAGVGRTHWRLPIPLPPMRKLI